MVKLVVIGKGGDVKRATLNGTDRGELHRKAGVKTSKDFARRTVWTVPGQKGKTEVELWARTSGRAGTENKYDFPPPVDTELYFGTCVLLRRDPATGDPIDLSVQEWSGIYETLFGGFEDLCEETSSEDELDGVCPSMKTRHGYAKDGFVCDGSSDGESVDAESDESCELVPARAMASANASDSERSDGGGWNDSYDASELAPEAYIYSDED
jgi:hypothetical protein